MDELNKAESVTSISKGTRVTADIKTDSDIHISGTVEGDVETNKRLVISEQGKVTGSVIADEASISGKFTGDLRVLKYITLTKTAFVDGFIFSKSISVDEDATLIGILNIGDDVDVLNAKLKKAEKKSVQPKDEEPAKNEVSEGKDQKQLEIEEQEPPKPTQNRYLKNVLIGIPGAVDKEKAESIRTACEHFMNALGFNLEIFDEPTDAPFYQKLSYTRKSPESAEDIQKRFENAKETLESALLNKGETGNGTELQKAANELVKQLRELEEFAIVLGEVVLVQLMENDVQTLAAEVASEELHKKLSNSPEMVSIPSKVYAFVEK